MLLSQWAADHLPRGWGKLFQGCPQHGCCAPPAAGSSESFYVITFPQLNREALKCFLRLFFFFFNAMAPIKVCVSFCSFFLKLSFY